jgi:tyrosinase
MMKALPSSNPLSWEFQAQIHNNSCKHHNWLWLPWHRAYLVYFERICRKLTGDNTFAMPYWNWNTHPAVPDPFWDTSSSLYDANRCVTQTEPADQSYIGTSNLQMILSEPNFELFASSPPTSSDLHDDPGGIQGMLEASPHNNIHEFVGYSSSPSCFGDMGSFISPRDPVFYTHHCMLDCLWTHWNIDLGNANTNDPTWMNFSITDFYDENGNPATVSVATTLLFPILSYQYEPCSLVTAGAGQIKLQGKALEKFLRTGAPSKLEYVQRFELRQTITAEIRKPATVTVNVQASAFSNAIQNGSRNRVVLTVADVEVPERKDFYVRIFLNKPDVSAQTSIDDPHYAGSFGFFFDESAMKNHAGEQAHSGPGRPKTGYLVDLTPALQKLSQAGSLPSDKVNVSFVAVPYGRREASGHLTLQRLELAAVRF